MLLQNNLMNERPRKTRIPEDQLIEEVQPQLSEVLNGTRDSFSRSEALLLAARSLSLNRNLSLPRATAVVLAAYLRRSDR